MILLEIMTTEKATELKQTLLDANDQALQQTEQAQQQARSMKERLRASRLEAATLPSLVIAIQASQVFVAISIMAEASPAVEKTSWLPGLNPYHPTHRMNTPSAANVKL